MGGRRRTQGSPLEPMTARGRPIGIYDLLLPTHDHSRETHGRPVGQQYSPRDPMDDPQGTHERPMGHPWHTHG